MSAFVVGNQHITAMLSILEASFPVSPASYRYNGQAYYYRANKQELGQKLIDQNYRSVNYRYDEDTPVPEFQLALGGHLWTPVEIIKACHCYNYQSCETSDWEDTEAYAISKMIERQAVRMLPGYNEAQAWPIV